MKTIDAFLTSRRNSSRESTGYKQKVLLGESNGLSPQNGTKHTGVVDSSQAIKRRLYIKDFNSTNVITDSSSNQKRLQSGTKALLQSVSREFRQGNSSLLESSSNAMQNPNTGSYGALDQISTSKLENEGYGWPNNVYRVNQSPEESVLIVGDDSGRKDEQELHKSDSQLVVCQSDPYYVKQTSPRRNLFQPGSLSEDLDCLPSTQPTTHPSAGGFTDRRLGDILQNLEQFVCQKDQNILQLECENLRLKQILREHGIPF